MCSTSERILLIEPLLPLITVSCMDLVSYPDSWRVGRGSGYRTSMDLAWLYACSICIVNNKLTQLFLQNKTWYTNLNYFDDISGCHQTFLHCLLFWRDVQEYKSLFTADSFIPCAVERKAKVNLLEKCTPTSELYCVHIYICHLCCSCGNFCMGRRELDIGLALAFCIYSLLDTFYQNIFISKSP